MKNDSRRMLILLLSGLATAPAFMDPIGLELQRRLSRCAAQVETVSLFPYGDWGRKAFVQLGEIVFDYGLPSSRHARAIGASRIWPSLNGIIEDSVLLIVGHSGGGVAGIHAARRIRANSPNTTVYNVLIGSPRCRLTLEERESTLSIAASPRNGRMVDRVARLGSWAGWERGKGGLVSWNPYKYAPHARFELPLIGGHPDYFRAYEPYVNDEGQSNLELTAGCIERWTAAKLCSGQLPIRGKVNGRGEGILQ